MYTGHPAESTPDGLFSGDSRLLLSPRSLLQGHQEAVLAYRGLSMYVTYGMQGKGSMHRTGFLLMFYM